jgi:hypothetical protein
MALVWSQTRPSVAKKFGVADNEIKFGKSIPGRRQAAYGMLA